MRLFGALGGLADDELRATFNGGIGMVVVVAPEVAETTIARLDRDGIAASVIGAVVPVDELGGNRYREELLP